MNVILLVVIANRSAGRDAEVISAYNNGHMILHRPLQRSMCQIRHCFSLCFSSAHDIGHDCRHDRNSQFSLFCPAQAVSDCATRFPHNMSITIKVVGLGHNLTAQFAHDERWSTVQDWITEQTGLPQAYQRFVSRHLNFDVENDDAPATTTTTSKTLAEIGVQDRTKIMLLHSAQYGPH
jgi:hypothetical protein